MKKFILESKPVKNYSQVFVILALTMLGSPGCASSQKEMVLDPVGPSPIPSIRTASTNGLLVVYSASEAVPDLSAEVSGNPSDHWVYSDYRILSADDKPFKFVRNNGGAILLHPKQIELPAGRYVVVAKANDFGRVIVPIVIASNRITTLHLDDDDGFRPGASGSERMNTVHLPNGNIVGWRALAEAGTQ